MSDGLLEDIIQLEKRIQAKISSEKERAKAWQERELTALEATLSRSKQQIERCGHEELAKLREEVLNQGKALETAAAGWCQRLTTLDDATLCRALRGHLSAILPGGDNDHPHGQN